MIPQEPARVAPAPAPGIERLSSGGPFEAAVGYSRAVRAGSAVAVSGTTAALPGGSAVGGADAGEQAREALRRILAALAHFGLGPADVVRTRIYLTDITSWPQVGAVHAAVFGDHPPASTMVEVTRLIDPALVVEIEADAIVSGS